MTPRAAIFDFGGVMTEPIFRRPRGISPEFAELGRFFLEEAMVVYDGSAGQHDLHLLETGHLSEADFFANLCQRFAAAGGPPIDPVAARSAVFDTDIVACRAMVDAVRDVRAAGYRTALLTNNAREWAPQWRPVLALETLFDVVVDSSEVGLRKPDPAIYRLTCDRLGVEAADCTFVDDIPCNVTAAAELGMDAILCLDPVVAAGVVRERLLGEPAVVESPR